MAKSSKPVPNAFVRGARKVYNPIGFSKGYNFVLFFILAGAFFGFALARLQYLNIDGVFCARNGANSALPGECFYYSQKLYRTGMLLHLATILPTALLVVFQFVPWVRYRFLIVHRIDGYIILLATLISNAGVIIISWHAFGGDLATQSISGLMVIYTTIGLAMAYYNIKKLQIDQHRAWMLRVFVLMGAIITTRIILIISANIVTTQHNYYTTMPCGKVAYAINNSTQLAERYPQCVDNPDMVVAVLAKFGKGGTPDTIAASFNLSFGMALWLSAAIHVFGTEVYLRLTPRESARLRQVSYERQVEAGIKNPGSAGLVVERFGDAEPWQPSSRRETKRASIPDDSSEKLAVRHDSG